MNINIFHNIILVIVHIRGNMNKHAFQVCFIILLLPKSSLSYFPQTGFCATRISVSLSDCCNFGDYPHLHYHYHCHLQLHYLWFQVPATLISNVREKTTLVEGKITSEEEKTFSINTSEAMNEKNCS